VNPIGRPMSSNWDSAFIKAAMSKRKRKANP
jgi:hypothetical protein